MPFGGDGLALADLRALLDALEAAGELRRVRVPVDARLEITEIVDRTSKAGGPALLFERVGDAALPVAVNLFGSRRRVAIALGVQDVDELAGRLEALLGLAKRRPKGLGGLLSILPDLKPLLAMPPRRMRGTAPVQTEILRGEDVDLTALPALQCWPGDGGRFLTLAQVITRDPESGERNVGVYRLQVHGPRALGLHWERHKGGAGHWGRARAAGRPLEVAVALGGDPASIYAAGAPLPAGFDEFAFAGFLRGAPVELCPGVTVDLEVPAQAEIVIEGLVAPDDLLPEGPFGDHTGFYDPGGPYPVLRVSAMTRRRDAIFPAAVVGRPPMEDYWLLGDTSERLFLPLIRAVQPDIADVHVPPEGVANNLVLIALRKRYPGHALQAAMGLLGLGLLGLSKVLVVVDDWVRVRAPGEAWWAALCNLDPGRDLQILRGPGSVLDHALTQYAFGGKLILDGTRKWPEELAGVDAARRHWPDAVTMAPEVVAEVSRRWAEYGIGPDPGPTGALPSSPPPTWSGAAE